MSIQFILGTGSANHEEELLQQANDWLAQSSAHQVYFLVPNYIKFEKEIQLLRKSALLKGVDAKKAVASTNLQVFSFARLAWYLLGDTDLATGESLSESGTAMLFRKILLENKQDIHLFAGELQKSGFITQIIDLFDEFAKGKITQEDLADFIQKGQSDELGQRKFAEILLIFEKYQDAIEQYQLASTSVLEKLTTKLPQLDMEKTMIIVSGYPWFNAEELALVEALMQKADEFRLAIVTDEAKPNMELNALELFYDGKRLYQTLYHKSRELGLKILSDKWAKEMPENTTIDKVWRNLADNKKLEVEPLAQGKVQLWKSENPISEVDKVAKEIHRLVSEEGYRYKDIQILTRDLASYHSHLSPILAWNDIPFTMDRTDDVRNHPLVEFLRSLFAVNDYYFQYEDVLRLLRSELFVPFHEEAAWEIGASLDLFSEEAASTLTLSQWEEQMKNFRAQVDITENIVLQYGYGKSDWTRQKDWKFVTYDFSDEEVTENSDVQKEQISNYIRRFVGLTLKEFFEKLKSAKTGLQAIEIFYDFLIESKVEKQILYLRDFSAVTDTEKARDYEQVWSALMGILDEYAKIFGEDTFDYDSFVEILTTGLESHKYGKLPATIDTVQVTSMELARPMQAKVVFAIGLTNHTLPKTYENKSLLTQEERDLLEGSLEDGKYFYNDVRKRSAKEAYLAYSLFLSASEKLYLTYPETVNKVKDNRISPMVARFASALGISEEKRFEANISDNSQEAIKQISTYRILVRDLMRLYQQNSLKPEEKPAVLWQAAERELAKSTLSQKFSKVKESLSHQNIPGKLDEEVVDELYGKKIQASVSRFELFHNCEYHHFANYGLNLKERAVLEINPAITGSYFHEGLDIFFKLLLESNLSLKEASEEEVAALAEKTLQNLMNTSQFDLLKRDARMRYLENQLSNVIRRVLHTLKKQASLSSLTTEATELMFGTIAGQKGIDEIAFDLGNGKSVGLRGKIDRIDSIEIADGKYLGVIDYKSGAKNFDLADNYYGLAMQMITYLDVAMTNYSKDMNAKPLGSLYFHLQNPELKAEEVPESQLEDTLLKEFKYKGFLLEDEKLLANMEENYGSVYPIREFKNGIKPTGTSFTEDDLGVVLQHNRQNFVNAGKEIVSGNIQLNPVREGSHPRACAYCPLRSVCVFDPTLKENEYKNMQNFGSLKDKKNNIITTMKEELELD